MVVGNDAAHTPSRFKVFSEMPVVTIKGGAPAGEDRKDRRMRRRTMGREEVGSLMAMCGQARQDKTRQDRQSRGREHHSRVHDLIDSQHKHKERRGREGSG